MGVFIKPIVSVIAAAAVLGVAGCTPKTVRDGTYSDIVTVPQAREAVTIADLEVSPNKAMGQATGHVDAPRRAGERISNSVLERAALSRALKSGDSTGLSADVLVSPQFHYKRVGDQLTVTVVGYPATYKNFRPLESPSRGGLLTVEKVGGVTFIGYDPSLAEVKELNNHYLISRPSGAGGALSSAPADSSAKTEAPPVPASLETPAAAGDQ